MDLNHPNQAIYPIKASQLNAMFDPARKQLQMQLVLKHQQQLLGHRHLGPPTQIYKKEERIQANPKASPSFGKRYIRSQKEIYTTSLEFQVIIKETKKQHIIKKRSSFHKCNYSTLHQLSSVSVF